MSRGAFASQKQYEDFTLSSTGDHSDVEGISAFEHMQKPFPLKSTLPSDFRRSTLHPPTSRHPLPKGWSPSMRRNLGHYKDETEEVTLSTDLTSAADDYVIQANEDHQRRSDSMYEDDSFIPGVGRGVHRSNANGGASYSAHRDLLASSHFAVHPSPNRALRHDRLRASTSKLQMLGQEYQKSASSTTTTTTEEEDSESDNETSSTSTASHALQPRNVMPSKAESTGNHQELDESIVEARTAPRKERPRLDARALDEMDRAVRSGNIFLRQEVPHSSSPASSHHNTPRAIRSRKEDQMSRQGQSPFKSSGKRVMHGEEREGRKPSDSSSNGKKQAGTTGSTSGDTLVEGRDREANQSRASLLQRDQGSPFMKLPSGQKMGKAVGLGNKVFLPDVTGMTSALDSPIKAIVGVEHRAMLPHVIQARHLQTTGKRSDEFNDLAKYVKTVEMELDQTQRKIQAVEKKSTMCVKEVDALRNEWSTFKSRKERKTLHKDDLNKDTADEDMDDYDGKVKAINQHIAHLTRDLQSYRETMEKMRNAKEKAEQVREQQMIEKQKKLAERRRLAEQSRINLLRSSSPLKPSRSDEDDESAHLEMVSLRKQVNKVAKEVERLRNIVDADDHVQTEGIASKFPPTEKLIRFSAVNPALRRSIGVGSQSPFRRSTGTNAIDNNVSEEEFSIARPSSPLATSVRGFREDEDDILADETVRPIQESRTAEVVDGDVSVMAQSRAERVFEAVDAHEDHNEKTCTVCRGKMKRDKRQQARRDRILQEAASRREIVDNDEHDDEHEGQEELIASLLDAATFDDDGEASKALPRSRKHHSLIQRLLKEHMDEFHHHRMLYCELADELKVFSPDLNRIKRKILAEHVMEAVEGLEFRARRINILQDVLRETTEERSGDANEAKSAKYRGKKTHPRHKAVNVDRSELYRRVVSA